jgi:hypothetical protein
VGVSSNSSFGWSISGGGIGVLDIKMEIPARVMDKISAMASGFQCSISTDTAAPIPKINRASA